MSKFKVGDKVRKITGYPFQGTVCAAYENEEKCCVKHADKWEHIFSDKQLTYDHPEYQYLDLIKEIIETGEDRDDRTGVGTKALFGKTLRFDLHEGFPALTTKRLVWKAVVAELLWFLSGSGNERDLRLIQHGNLDKETIWTANAEAPYWKNIDNDSGDLGRVYGVQWRSWRTVDRFEGPFGYHPILRETDQIANLIKGLQEDPWSRRHILTAWNPGELDQMALPPCHMLAQFYVNNKYELSCQLTQRSADIGLGIPFNIASYALLTNLLAREAGLSGVSELIITIGDAHVYKNHIEALTEQLEREPFKFPSISIADKPLDELTVDDIKLIDYQSHKSIKMDMAV